MPIFYMSYLSMFIRLVAIKLSFRSEAYQLHADVSLNYNLYKVGSMKNLRLVFISLIALLLSGTCLANIVIKADAPTEYRVQKGDTLWHISELFLDKPWLWPELWRTNAQIENPHLIYPGDILALKFDQGQPYIELIREKRSLIMSPQALVKDKPMPIDVLPWSRIAPFVLQTNVLDEASYQNLPYVLGDVEGTPIYASQDYAISHALRSNADGFRIVRKVRDLRDASGKKMGVQLSHVAHLQISSSIKDNYPLVQILDARQEVRAGDKVLPAGGEDKQNLYLHSASNQVGEIISNAELRQLSAQNDVVLINLGTDSVAPGTVLGIYRQGPTIVDPMQRPNKVEQPALKIGELVVFEVFAGTSLAWVSKANTYLRGGEMVSAP